jgi:hypothetical protein
VYEHYETHNDVLAACLSVPYEKEAAHAHIPHLAERFVALDVHKHSVVAGAVTAGQQVVLAPRRVNLDDLPDWSQRHLRPTDAVVLSSLDQCLAPQQSAAPPGGLGHGRTSVGSRN